LLALDLPSFYAGDTIKKIDLAGSADHLKDTVSTGQRRRMEMVWPVGREALAILQERRAYDVRAEATYRSGMGIRAAYLHRAVGAAE
jgi:hypothetical protein